MIGVIVTAMVKGFVRDRGAVMMSVVLPIAVFLVFAAIFSGASGEQLRIKVAIADEQRSEPSGRLLGALAHDSALTVEVVDSAATVRALVRRGAVDAGLVVRRDGRPLTDLSGDGEPPILIVVDPVRAVAGNMLAGQIQRAYFGALPDVALRTTADLLGEAFVTFTPAQRDSLDRGFADLAREVGASSADDAGDGPFDGLIARESMGNPALGRGHVAYYAGGVAILFLLFSAVHGALSILEERDTGLLDRLLAGPGGMNAVIGGKFVFLVGQGFLQVTLIFVVAWLGWGIRLPERLGGFAAMTLAASVAAAGLALALTTVCRTRRQAQTLSNVAILMLSAIGGSMVPRFLMPGWLQSIGWVTPTTWAVEGYSALFWRGEPLSAIALPVALLTVTGFGALVLARVAARREERI